MLLRANVLAKGYSGARPDLAELLCGMLNAGLHPLVPEQGSVGASGDLAPLAHLALALIGEGDLVDRRRARASGGRRARARRASARWCWGRRKGSRSSTARRRIPPSPRSPCIDIASPLAGGAHRRRDVARGADGHPRRLRRAHPRRARPARPGRLGGAAPRAARRRARSASRTATATRACRMRMRCAACRRCTGRCWMRIDFAAGVIGRELNAATDNPLVLDDGDAAQRRQLPRPGRRDGARLPRDRARPTSRRSRSGASTGSCIPDLNQGLPPFLTRDAGVNSGFMMAQVTAAALASECKVLVASGERRHHPDRRQQGGRGADGDGRGVEAAPRRAATCGTCLRSS